jgi:hypothetical protein
MKTQFIRYRKLILPLIIVSLVAGMVYAVAMALEEIPNKCGEARLDTRKNDLGAIQVAGQKEETDPKPDINLERKITQLGSFYQRANEERRTDQAVSGKTRADAATLANGIKTICDANAKNALKDGLPKASKLYSYAGENIVFETEVYTKDQISAKDMDEIRERLKGEQKLLEEAYNEIDPSSLTPAQKNYLQTVSLKNLQKNLSNSQKLFSDLKAVVSNIQSTVQGVRGGGAGCVMAAVEQARRIPDLSRAGAADLGTSLVRFLETLIKNITSSLTSIKRLVQS